MFRRLGYVRTLLVTDVGRLAVVVTLLVLPSRLLSFPLYLGLLLAFSAASHLGGGTVWQPLMRDITTVNDRGRFFARMRLLFTLVGTLLTAVVPLLVGTTLTEAQYKLLLVIPLVGLINHTLWVRRIPEPPHEAEAGETTNLKSMMRSLRKSPLLRRPLLIFLAVQFSLFPLLPVYLRQILGIPANIVSIYLFCVSLGSAASFALFGRISDSMGFKPLLTEVLVIASVTSPLYLLITPLGPEWVGMASAAWPERISVISLLLVGLITGSVSAGAGLGLTSIQHYFVSSRDSLVSMNAFSSLTVLIVSVQSLFYGFLIDEVTAPLGNLPIIPGHLSADAVKIYLVVGATAARIVALIVARKLPNLRAFFGLSDFFSALSPASIRSILIGRRTAHDDESTRLVAARRMGLQATPLGVDPLLSLLEDPAYDVKVEAIRALATTASVVAGARLLEELERDEMALLSDHIAWAIGELAYAPAKAALVTRATDSSRSPRVRAAAARALGKIGDLSSVRPLIEIVRSEHLEIVKAAAMIALIQLGDRDGMQESLIGLKGIIGSLTERELLYNLCLRYSLPTSWLLALARGTAARAALLDYFEQRPLSWQTRRSDIVHAVRQRDYDRVRQGASAIKNNPQEQVLTSDEQILLECAGRIEAWSPLTKLVALWLLEHQEQGT